MVRKFFVGGNWKCVSPKEKDKCVKEKNRDRNSQRNNIVLHNFMLQCDFVCISWPMIVSYYCVNRVGDQETSSKRHTIRATISSLCQFPSNHDYTIMRGPRCWLMHPLQLASLNFTLKTVFLNSYPLLMFGSLPETFFKSIVRAMN